MGRVSTVLNPFPTSIYFQSYARHPEKICSWYGTKKRIGRPQCSGCICSFIPVLSLHFQISDLSQVFLSDRTRDATNPSSTRPPGDDAAAALLLQGRTEKSSTAGPVPTRSSTKQHEWPRRTRASGARAHAVSPLVPRAGQSPPPLDAGPAV